jgi:hypothetical protein
MFTLDWALDNVRADAMDEAEKIKTIIVALKPWLNLELYQAEEKAKNNPTLVSTTYLDDLRKHGATEEELARIAKDMEKLNNKPSANTPSPVIGMDDDDGPMTVLSPTQPISVNTHHG